MYPVLICVSSSGPALTVPAMYVKFSIPHIYFLSNISIVLKPTLETTLETTLKLHRELVWRNFLIFSIIRISSDVAQAVKYVEFVVNCIY